MSNVIPPAQMDDEMLKTYWDSIDAAWDHWTAMQRSNPDAALQEKLDKLEAVMKTIQYEFKQRGIKHY